MRILITGGAGFIGGRVAASALAAGHAVTVVDDLSTGFRDQVPAGARFEQMDVLSPEFQRLVTALRPEVLSHHAAHTSVRDSFQDPALDAQLNVLGTIAALTAVVAAAVPTVIYASSIAVIGEPQVLPVSEGHPVAPLSPYGVSKLAGEHYVTMYARAYHFRAVTFRYGNVYGPGQGRNGHAGIVHILSRKMLAGQPVRIFGDGEQTRDFVYVDDVADANLRAATTRAAGLFHVGSGQSTSVNALVAELAALTGRPPHTEHVEAVPGEIRASVLDPSRAWSILGWRARTSLGDGLRAVVTAQRAEAGAPA